MVTRNKTSVVNETLEPLIVRVRGQRVILDADLARVYGVTTKRLNEAFKRNQERFPQDFSFRLTPAEFAGLKMLQPHDFIEKNGNWSQIATSSSKHRATVYSPMAFTEHHQRIFTTTLPTIAFDSTYFLASGI